MSDWTRSFLGLLAEAGVHPRLADGRLVARLGHLPPPWRDDVRVLLSTHRAEVIAELCERDRQRLDQPGAHDAFADALRGAR